ncbi:hypothetical protein K505DRAFT_339876 [Melanomma pulvis-pyrius CBS 109.77]|uniref:Uncharacterized protein n=1 Tax=Melanomma pulvis-pyrius CBS 109.77 TaxID=1314802 RepID=A0A6A6X4L6_9PLEO|nr:hypothetical protein K505DRAFT_339876 [Melanomma pulvis-pyrius CBS 109.77]
MASSTALNYGIRLTIFYLSILDPHANERLCNTVLLKRRFETPDDGNDEALQLANCCRAEGEVAMLVTAHANEVTGLKEYIVRKRLALPDTDHAQSVHDVAENIQGYFSRKALAENVSARVQVVVVDDEEIYGKEMSEVGRTDKRCRIEEESDEVRKEYKKVRRCVQYGEKMEHDEMQILRRLDNGIASILEE